MNAIESFLALLYVIWKSSGEKYSNMTYHLQRNANDYLCRFQTTPRMNSTNCHEFKLEMSKMTHITLGVSVSEGSN